MTAQVPFMPRKHGTQRPDHLRIRRLRQASPQGRSAITTYYSWDVTAADGGPNPAGAVTLAYEPSAAGSRSNVLRSRAVRQGLRRQGV